LHFLFLNSFRHSQYLSTAFVANLAEATNRADALARKLEQSEKAREEAEAVAKKAKAEAATVEDLRKRLHMAESSLSEHISQQSAREEAVIKRLASQSRRFVSKYPNYFDCFELLLSCLLIDKLLS
jgi:septal ring factor EnvC (AmiA/AmiB activator)